MAEARNATMSRQARKLDMVLAEVVVQMVHNSSKRVMPEIVVSAANGSMRSNTAVSEYANTCM